MTEQLEEFKNELSVREKCDIKPQQNPTEKQKIQHQPSAMGLYSGSAKISCAFCKGNHSMINVKLLQTFLLEKNPYEGVANVLFV